MQGGHEECGVPGRQHARTESTSDSWCGATIGTSHFGQAVCDSNGRLQDGWDGVFICDEGPQGGRLPGRVGQLRARVPPDTPGCGTGHGAQAQARHPLSGGSAGCMLRDHHRHAHRCHVRAPQHLRGSGARRGPHQQGPPVGEGRGGTAPGPRPGGCLQGRPPPPAPRQLACHGAARRSAWERQNQSEFCFESVFHVQFSSQQHHRRRFRRRSSCGTCGRLLEG
mmetsp:Transcript_15248/g.46043  ORF Transcript_15248/g.46043 Transcript_15248/m.46043 type:complete len:224 (+) Transcript_15248:3114-3785(+)